MALSDSNYKHCPSKDEWSKVEKICNFLGEFYNVTKVFSGTKYATTNLYFPAVFLVQRKLLTEKESLDEFLSSMATKMYSKFSKYWSEFSMILAIAVILDPHFKLYFVAFSYTKIYGYDSREIKRVRDNLFSLFNEYLHDSPSPMSTKATSQTVGSCSYEREEALWTKESRDIMQVI
ncbi:zinc finger BED domain-containing protein RICESLEEPER 1-like [Cornus florida]|uniref:zinc finger BED domain-containing protein RICESLEEPER 1-like n=1 Tax=Cornus florida TaxID=4283 RepID=UPI00289A7AA2|nr:zinc finger BED domain-containing protein RICESLEEPER 1-like [Cornus florida]